MRTSGPGLTLGGGPVSAGLALDLAGGGGGHELFLTYNDKSEGDKIISVDATDLQSGARRRQHGRAARVATLLSVNQHMTALATRTCSKRDGACHTHMQQAARK